jgi:putative ABC transport system permease protein
MMRVSRFAADIVVRLVARLVPPAVRPRWKEEWRGELDHAAAAFGSRRFGALRLFRMALGAPPDALIVRRPPRVSFPGAPRPRLLAGGLTQDVRFALRTLIASPGFALTVVASLGLGIAVNTTTFSLMNAAIFWPFPGISDQHRLVQIALRDCGRHCFSGPSSYQDYLALREGVSGLEGLAAKTSADLAVMIEGEPLSLRGAFVSGNYFDVLGVRPALGRGFGPEHDQPANAFVAVIADSLWRREFHSDPAALGRFIDLPGGSARIVGVAPKYFVGAAKSDLLGGRPGSGTSGRLEIWLPLPLADVVSRAEATEAWGLSVRPVAGRYFHYVGRLREGTDAALIHTQASVVAARISAARRDSRSTTDAEVTEVGLIEARHIAGFVGLFLTVPLVVLAIACLNAANLLLARATRRSGEIAIRLALGATRWQIVRQLLTESLLLSLAAAGGAMILSSWGLQIGTSYLGFPLPLDYRVLMYTLLAAVASAVAFGLVPALRAARGHSAGALIAARSGGETLRQSRVRRALVVAQVALSLGLLATGTQLVSSVRSLVSVAGTEPDRLLLASFDLSHLKFERPATEAFYKQLLDRVSTLPQAQAAGLARSTTFWTWGMGMRSAVVVWLPDDEPRKGTLYLGGYAGGELFRAAGLNLLQGRAFTQDEAGARPAVAVVNRPFADKVFAGAAVGRHVRVAARGQGHSASLEVRIVGVVEPTVEPMYSRDPVPAIYLPASLEDEPALTLYVRSNGPMQALVPALRDAVGQIDARVPFTEIATLQELNDRRLRPDTLMTQGVSLLGILALVLATAGLYGVISYMVALRTREIGVRLALGAEPRGVLAMVLRQAMTLALVGTAIGAGAAAIATRVAQSELRGAERFDPLAFVGSIALLLVAMLAGSALPARRAARVDPMVALRHE